MADFDHAAALRLLKARLNRMAGDTSLDDTLAARISAEASALTRTGIILTDSPDDLLLVVDGAAWAYQSRDKKAGVPEWLRIRRRERWLQQR